MNNNQKTKKDNSSIFIVLGLTALFFGPVAGWVAYNKISKNNQTKRFAEKNKFSEYFFNTIKQQILNDSTAVSYDKAPCYNMSKMTTDSLDYTKAIKNAAFARYKHGADFDKEFERISNSDLQKNINEYKKVCKDLKLARKEKQK